MSNSKETMTKKQQDDLVSTFNNVPWGLPLSFPSMPPLGAFPPFGLPTPNFPPLHSFTPSTVTNFPPPSTSSLLGNDPTNSTPTDIWSNGLSTTNSNIDYNEYAKQLGFLLNAFNEKPKQSETDKSKSSTKIKSSKSKRTTPSSSSDIINDKNSTTKSVDESHPRPTSTSSSSTSSRRSSSNNQNKSSKSSSSNSKPNENSNLTSSTMIDPLAFVAAATAASGGLTFPYFLPSLLSTNSSTNNNNNNNNINSSPNYPFSTLSASLLNPTATLYPFLSPDWFTSPSKFVDKSADSKDSTSHKISKSKVLTSENKHLSSVNETSSFSSKSKKRAKSIRVLTEEQELNQEKVCSNNQTRKLTSTNSSLLHSALTDPTNGNLLNLSRRSSINESSSNRQTPLIQSADESRSNDDDDSDPNPKRRKTEEVNETFLRIPLSRGWKRVTIVRAITRTGVRGDVSYFAPCGRKLRSFQEIDRYLSKKNINDLDRSHFTFSSKVHIGHFHEPKEGPDGKTIFQESTEDEIVNRIFEINPKFRRIKYESECETPTKNSSPSVTPNLNNCSNDFQQQIYEENRKFRHEQEEISKRNSEIKTKHDTMRLLRNITSESSKTSEQYQHNEFLKAIIEQQEQERKRQELAYLKQLEIKKRQEEKLLLIEQRKAEKNAQREKKIQEKYMEIVLTKERKRIGEDMQLRDTKPLPILKPVENNRLTIEAFANSLMIIQFLNNFKHIFHIPEHLIPTLNSFQQSSSSRDINSLCQILLNLSLEDPGIPNPKKCLTNLGQKLSEIDITEHTFSEILRLYIRERNGFDDKITQSLSDTSFQSLSIDEKIEILAFLCNDLSANKRVVEEVDRTLDELTNLKHEKLEIEKRLRRLKFEKSNNSNYNNVKKLAALIREKDLNSSDNESPDETDEETIKNDDETLITNDPAATMADDQDIETIDETKIDDLDKRLTLVTRKYTLIKRRVIDKHCRTRALHLGQDRFRRRYWFFSHLPGIYVEGLTSGDISPNDIKDFVQQVTKQKLDKTGEINTLSRSSQRKKQSTKIVNTTTPPPSVNSNELNKTNFQQQEINSSTNISDDLTTIDLSAFCQSVQRDENKIENEQTNIIKIETTEDLNNNNNKRDLNQINDDNLPLDLSCSKSKRSCNDDHWTLQHTQAAYPLTSTLNQFKELNDLATTAILLNNIKQENTPTKNLLDLTITNPILSSTNNFKQIEQSIREKFQYSQPLPIPDDVQSGWWSIQTAEELRNLMKSLIKRGQRERYLCRMLQRYFDVLTNSMKSNSQSNIKNETPPPSNRNDSEFDNDNQQQISFNDSIDNSNINSDDDRYEMDILNEIYNFLDRIVASSLQCRSFDINSSRKRLTYSDIQSKGSDILDEAKHLLTDIERNIERRYLKHPFVRKYEINLSSLNRINQNSTYHHTLENSTNEIVSTSKYDEVPQQLERWRRTVNESRTPAQLALCLTQLERCIAWERSVMKVYCEICNSDNDEEKLLLCDGCDHGTHTYCFIPPMSFIPPNDWYCYVCIGKAKGENLCFVCGNEGDNQLNRCEHCGKLFHEDCLKNAKQQRGKWLCVLCAANETTSINNGNTTTKTSVGRQTSRSINSRQPINTNGDTNNQSTSITNTNRNKSTNNHNNRKSKINENLTLHESHSNSSHADLTTISNLNDSSSMDTNDIDDDNMTSPIMTNNNNKDNNSKKKSSTKSKTNNDVKSCRIILNELLKSDVSWPFQTPVDAKQHPEYYECIKTPMDFSTMKKKMRNNQYTNRDEFLHDVELILNNCEYYNEDDSPVGQAGHLLRTFFQSQWTKQFG